MASSKAFARVTNFSSQRYFHLGPRDLKKVVAAILTCLAKSSRDIINLAPEECTGIKPKTSLSVNYINSLKTLKNE